MRVFRLCKAKYATRAFDGEGARLHGGRWNSPGVTVVYTSSSLSLAALEQLVHFDHDDAPTDYMAMAVDIPDDVAQTVVDAASLPADWRDIPAPKLLVQTGDEWVRAGGTAVLSVPSALVPAERNFLLNPKHPDFSRWTIRPPEAFTFDSRLTQPAPAATAPARKRTRRPSAKEKK